MMARGTQGSFPTIGLSGKDVGTRSRHEWSRCRERAVKILGNPAIILPAVFILAFAVADAGIGREPLSWAIAGALVAALGIIVAADNMKLWIISYPLVFVAPRLKVGDWSEGGDKLFGLQLYDPWILLLVCLWVPRIVATKQINLPRSVKTGLVLLMVVGLWSIRIAPERGLALRIAGRTFFEPLMLFAVITALRWTRSEIRVAAGLFTGVAAVVAGISFFGYFSEEGAIQAQDVTRLQSYWEGANQLAAFLVGAIPVALGMLLSVSSVKGRLVVLGALLVQPVALVLTYTRGSWLALAGGMGVMLVLLRRWGWILLAVLLATLVVVAGPPDVMKRVESIIAFESVRSATNRLVLWPKVASLIAARPVFGYGFGGYQVLYSTKSEFRSLHAHNILLDFALAIGIPGLVLVLLVIGYVLGRALVNVMEVSGKSKDVPLLMGLGIGCVAMLAAGMVDGSIPIWPNLSNAFWFLLALTYAMTSVVECELKLTRLGGPVGSGRR